MSVSSCSKDYFFKIEDKSNIDLQTMYDIAESKTYTDYLIASYIFMDRINNLDSTKRGHIEIYGKDTIYENINIISFKEVVELHDRLIEEYPVLKNVDEADLLQIQVIALSNNSTLKVVASNYKLSTIRTKSSNNDCYSFQWVENNADPYNSDYPSLYHYNDDGNSYELIPCTTIGLAMNAACIWSRNHEEAKTGGWGWTNSGMMIYDIKSTPSTMRMITVYGTPRPELDFYVHPDGNLFPTEDDLINWNNHTSGLFHMIVNYNHELSVW